MNKWILGLLALYALFVKTEAYEICYDYDNKQLFDCDNTYNTIGYCCNWYDGQYHSCCSYLQVWALWYFWFGIVMFLLFVGAVVGCCKRAMDKKKRRNSTSSNSDVAIGHVTSTNVVIPVTQPMPQPAVVAPDVPPTYQQVESQGISAQYKEFAHYGTPTAVSPVAIDSPPSSPHSP